MAVITCVCVCVSSMSLCDESDNSIDVLWYSSPSLGRSRDRAIHRMNVLHHVFYGLIWRQQLVL